MSLSTFIPGIVFSKHVFQNIVSQNIFLLPNFKSIQNYFNSELSIVADTYNPNTLGDRAGRSLEARSSRPGWATQWDPITTIKPKTNSGLGAVAHAYNPSTWEAKAGGS